MPDFSTMKEETKVLILMAALILLIGVGLICVNLPDEDKTWMPQGTIYNLTYDKDKLSWEIEYGDFNNKDIVYLSDPSGEFRSLPIIPDQGGSIWVNGKTGKVIALWERREGWVYVDGREANTHAE